MTIDPVVLINRMGVEPPNQAALLDLLKHNVDTVVKTLPGWRSSRLIASRDGASVTIYSEWDSPEAVDAMRADARMQAYLPRIRALANVESVVGAEVFCRELET